VRAVWILALVLGLGAAERANAYAVQAGDILLRPVVGVSVNTIRLDVATKSTPPAGLLMGLDVDYSIDGAWNVTGSLHPMFADGFLDTRLGLGAKYRVVQLEAPFIPYASLMATTALGTPLGYGDLHWNVGGRLAAGVDYFVMRDLAVGVEIAAEGSVLAIPLVTGELSAEALLGFTWRL
jgi:hypothetical protein